MDQHTSDPTNGGSEHKKTPCRYIVAVGGSAGSLRPIKEFFDHTPHDGAAYVILQHLPKGYQTQLQLVLRKHSSLAVNVITEGMSVSPDKVYVLPASQYAGIDAGGFHLMDREDRTINRSIDVFFTSLAAQRRYKPIVVLLSGTNSDGTLGVTEVKKAGGLTIAQEPRTCDYPVMPENAIATGNIDQVLRSQDMPGVILEYIGRDAGDQR